MSTTTGKHNETQIAAEPTLPTIVTTREFDAPPERVFRAHTDAELAAQWLACMDQGNRIDAYDARTGGWYRYVYTDPDGSEHAFHGVFHEVRPHERIVQTFTYEAIPDSVSLDTLTFEDLGDGRTRLTSTSLMGSFEARDGMLASGMETGVRAGHERLDEILAADNVR